jgi:hypothetical protein
MTGKLVLNAQGEGEKTKTKAELEMTWEGGAHTAMLGMAPGTCTEIDPLTVGEEVSLWSASCVGPEKTAQFGVLHTENEIVVQRRFLEEDGSPGEFKAVRKIALVEGAELQRSE